MVRPKIHRRVWAEPSVRYFKPQGIPLAQLEENTLTEDELEALRLADIEGLYHDDAAKQMGISRPTFGRILANARRNIAEAMMYGKAIRIQGGEIRRIRTPGFARGRRRGFGGRRRRGWTER